MRRHLIRDVLAGFSGVHVEPEIPAKKLANARAHCLVPTHEDVLGLIDCTVFGSAKQAVVFGEYRIYIRDRWTGNSVVNVGYTGLGRFDAIAAGARRITAPTRQVLDALRLAIDRMHAKSVRDAAVAHPTVLVDATAVVGAPHPAPLTFVDARTVFVAPDDVLGDDVSVTPEATALQAAITEAPGDEAPQLVLADLLLAAGDPRGELIVLHHRELSDALTDPDALEGYLALAAEYGFPHALPEEPTLPFVGSGTGPVRFMLAHELREYDIRFAGGTLEVLVGGHGVLSRRLRTEDRASWTVVETAVILRTLSDAIRAHTPLKSLQFPFVDDPLPMFAGAALRVYTLPRDYTRPRGIAPNRYGLAARDYQRWMDTWRRLARTLKKASSDGAVYLPIA